jgi:hypothetical protein
MGDYDDRQTLRRRIDQAVELLAERSGSAGTAAKIMSDLDDLIMAERQDAMDAAREEGYFAAQMNYDDGR